MKLIPDLYEKALKKSPEKSRTDISINHSQKYNIQSHIIREKLLWCEYLSSRERKYSLKLLLSLCIRYPWKIEIWRKFFLIMGNERIISLFIRIKNMLRRCKIIR